MGNMKIQIFTIVLDGMPWITKHLETLQQLKSDWEWSIVEGVAMPTRDTAWVAGVEPRLSVDGTHEYLEAIKSVKNVKVISQARWENKTDMVNAAIKDFTDGVLIQVDSDEIWTVSQLEKIADTFRQNPGLNGMKFFCNYFVGDGIVTLGENSYGNNSGEWLRAWRFRRGMQFNRHEPPVLNNTRHPVRMMSREKTRMAGLVFDHYSWVDPNQVKFKCQYYGKQYASGYEGWERLQKNESWPISLKQFLPWVDQNATANKIR